MCLTCLWLYSSNNDLLLRVGSNDYLCTVTQGYPCSYGPCFPDALGFFRPPASILYRVRDFRDFVEPGSLKPSGPPLKQYRPQTLGSDVNSNKTTGFVSLCPLCFRFSL